MALVDKARRTNFPVSMSNTRFFWTLGFVKRLVLMFEWETLCPFILVLLVNAQVAIRTPNFLLLTNAPYSIKIRAATGRPHFTPRIRNFS